MYLKKKQYLPFSHNFGKSPFHVLLWNCSNIVWKQWKSLFDWVQCDQYQYKYKQVHHLSHVGVTHCRNGHCLSSIPFYLCILQVLHLIICFYLQLTFQHCWMCDWNKHINNICETLWNATFIWQIYEYFQKNI